MARDLAGASVGSAVTMLGVPHDELATELAVSFRDSSITEMPGATTLVRALHGRVRLAVATNGPERLVRLGLERIGLDEAFQTVISAEQLPNPKPAPDVYLAACHALNVDPSDAVAVEDSPAGTRAALRAGLVVICIPSITAGGVHADLRARRLDDPIVLDYLGVAVASPPRGVTTRPRSE